MLTKQWGLRDSSENFLIMFPNNQSYHSYNVWQNICFLSKLAGRSNQKRHQTIGNWLVEMKLLFCSSWLLLRDGSPSRIRPSHMFYKPKIFPVVACALLHSSNIFFYLFPLLSSLLSSSPTKSSPGLVFLRKRLQILHGFRTAGRLISGHKHALSVPGVSYVQPGGSCSTTSRSCLSFLLPGWLRI